jgi:hypothetical protein
MGCEPFGFVALRCADELSPRLQARATLNKSAAGDRKLEVAGCLVDLTFMFSSIPPDWLSLFHESFDALLGVSGFH